MFLYKRENLKGGAAKCNYVVYRDTKFISAKNEELTSVYEDFCELQCLIHFLSETPEAMFFTVSFF